MVKRNEGETVSEAVGRSVKVARAVKGWTQAELGEKCGLGLAGISRRERGETPWTIEDLAKCAAALGLTARDLVPQEPQPGA